VIPGSAADFGKLIADETEKWARVIKFAGIKARSLPTHAGQARRPGARPHCARAIEGDDLLIARERLAYVQPYQL
jgi:hypothetical protein